MDKILWKPQSSDIQQSQMMKFLEYINTRYATAIADYFSLHQWSIQNIEKFWSAVWDFCQIIASTPTTHAFIPGKNMRAAQWFEGSRLNFAENLLKFRDQQLAIIAIAEDGSHQKLTYAMLYEQVNSVRHYLKNLGIKSGDRVVGILSNGIETVIAMLATTSLGAIWSTCSPDFGLDALIDRFGQIEPKVLFATNSHTYNGKTFNHLEKIQKLQEKMPQLIKTIIIPHSQLELNHLPNTVIFEEILASAEKSVLKFPQLPFNHPLYILYSSGTTGKPKCMVHGAGGTLIQHLKELMLHTNLRREDKIFFYTTCGWMMWNWLISSLAVGATIVLYDGSPFFPKPRRLFDLIDEYKINILGLGAKLIESCEKFALIPRKTHHLSSLKTILTTASPLLPESFDYVYRDIKTNVQLSSISGGSDIISCFALGNPLLPVYRGEIQCMGLGMDVKIFNDKGQAVQQQLGELVCTSPFPSMPIYFWDDPQGDLYEKAYFKKYPGVWAHGDYAMITEHQGLIITGRSDATLNPKGIRIGTAEIYNQIEKIEEIVDALAVGQEWESSERIILFVKLKEDVVLTSQLTEKIKKTIRENTSPHHVPAKIIAVPDLPRTISGKLVELAVKNIIHGKPLKNIEALANPESLSYFINLDELKS